MASLFDPLGMVCPVTIVGKIILQAAWKDTLEWDEEMSEPLQRQAREWWGDLKKIQSFKVERWCGATPETEHTLHCFSDASETAYGCCIYITSPTTRHLVYAKAKVAPVKRQTLARLELQAAFMASSALDMVCNHVRTPICEVHCWTDSLTTFHWLNKPPHHWKTWVANRVAAIQEVGLKWNTEWHHCPGVLNPADLVSRGVSLEKLEASKWLKGPDWITNKETWPLRTEVQEHQLVAETRVFSVQVTEKWWERFSSWDKIQRIMRVILRWRHFKDRTVNIARKVEISLWQIIQRDVFGEDLTTIKNGKSVSSSSKIHKFNPFLDEDGVLRVGGRLQQTTWPFERKHPVLLDKHHLTELLVRHHHIERKHQGVEGLVAFIRRSLWIIGGRKMIRKMKDKCIVCKKFDANPIDEIIAPLPAERVSYTYPFGICGIDYAGPLLANGGGRICKVWVALFVCATTRAVHLEMVTNLTTDEFLLAFRRFIARRAKPQKIFSDNATTFRAAAEAIQCTWEFNPPAAPWFGGFYERLVQSVKAPLQKVVGQALLHIQDLYTVLTEIEALINARPLTHEGDHTDKPAVTPAMLSGQIWQTTDLEIDTNRPELRKADMLKRTEHVKNVACHLKTRWQEEYVAQLRLFNRGAQPSLNRCIEVGDVVYVGNPQMKRRQWKLGLVTKVFPGRDGRIRVAEIKIGTKSFVRAVQNLVPLEVTAGTTADNVRQATSSSNTEPQQERDDRTPALSREVNTIPPQRKTRTRTIKAPERLNL